MTPEELNRTIEFLVQWQARMAARQEETAAKQEEHEAWTKDMIARLARVSEENSRLMKRQLEVLNVQSERMDRMDRLHENWSRQNAEILRLLKQIMDRLPPFPPNLN